LRNPHRGHRQSPLAERVMNRRSAFIVLSLLIIAFALYSLDQGQSSAPESPQTAELVTK